MSLVSACAFARALAAKRLYSWTLSIRSPEFRGIVFAWRAARWLAGRRIRKRSRRRNFPFAAQIKRGDFGAIGRRSRDRCASEQFPARGTNDRAQVRVNPYTD